MSRILEVIGFNIESCIAAQEGGAGRIEMCASPGEGGTTPSLGFIKSARKVLQIPLYVMVRPRGGDFLYSEEEFKIMQHEIRFIKEAGCDGVVIGILNSDGTVDKNRCAKLVDQAYPLGVTFHRAFDRVADPIQALQDVISVGCERILTSGLRPNVNEGLDMIKQLQTSANDDIIIMPGSGVRSANIQKIVRETGVFEIHSSASAQWPSSMHFINSEMKEDLSVVTVSLNEVKKMVAALNEIS